MENRYLRISFAKSRGETRAIRYLLSAIFKGAGRC